MSAEPFGRLDNSPEVREILLPYCRLKTGDIWEDPINGHKVGVLDATKLDDVQKIFGTERATLSVQDPPYNVVVGAENTENLYKWTLKDYMAYSKKWVDNNLKIISKDASVYIWLGADQRQHFQPLPDFRACWGFSFR